MDAGKYDRNRRNWLFRFIRSYFSFFSWPIFVALSSGLALIAVVGCSILGSRDDEPIKKGPIFVNPCFIAGANEYFRCALDYHGSDIVHFDNARSFVCYSPEDNEKIMRSLLVGQ